MTSRSTPKPTSSQPAPETPWTGPHTRTYANVVHGTNSKPSSGQTHVENAACTRSPKIHTSTKAKRGPMKNIESARQHMAAESSRSTTRLSIA